MGSCQTHYKQRSQPAERKSGESCLVSIFGTTYLTDGSSSKERIITFPSDQKFRLNGFRIIDRKSNYEGFTTTESINSDKIAEYLDNLLLRIMKKTFVVLDNAKIYRAKKSSAIVNFGKKRTFHILSSPIV